ncbi:MAG: hypothetical protein ACLUUG_12755 [Lachnospiraceae bacterium]
MKLVDDSFDEVNEKSTNDEEYRRRVCGDGVSDMYCMGVRIWQRN